MVLLPAALYFRGSFQLGNTGFNIFKFDTLEGAIKDALSRPKSDGRRDIHIGHQLQDGCGSGASGLLHPGNRLMDGFAARRAIFFHKLRHLQPSQQRLSSDTCGPGRLFHVPLRQQGGDRLLLFSGEF